MPLRPPTTSGRQREMGPGKKWFKNTKKTKRKKGFASYVTTGSKKGKRGGIYRSRKSGIGRGRSVYPAKGGFGLWNWKGVGRAGKRKQKPFRPSPRIEEPAFYR